MQDIGYAMQAWALNRIVLSRMIGNQTLTENVSPGLRSSKPETTVNVFVDGSKKRKELSFKQFIRWFPFILK